jgi:uncharacterized membrane protein YhaH (DUF805 family)
VNWRDYLFSVKGRAGRAQYWKILLAMFGIGLAGELIIARVTGLSFREFSHDVGGQGIWSESGRLVLLLMLPLQALAISLSNAINVKRLHDRNRSGWWLIVLVYGPWLTGFALGAFRDPHSIPLILADYTTRLLGLWGLVELGILRGTVGTNRFGPDPLKEA